MCVYIIKFTITILHVQFNGINCIESVLQPSPLFAPKTFSSPQTEAL